MNSNQSPLMGGEKQNEDAVSRMCREIDEELCSQEQNINQSSLEGDNVSSPSNSGDASVVSHSSTDNAPVERFRSWISEEIKLVGRYHSQTAGGAHMALLMVIQKFNGLFPQDPDAQASVATGDQGRTESPDNTPLP